MKAIVEKLEIPLNECIVQNLYKVDYTAAVGNGYSTNNAWRTFGVYEKEEIADFICDQIKKRYVEPIRQ